jgi:fructose-bisphosphate aldolase class II
MQVADYQTYCKMLDRAQEKKFAYPAINVTSMTTANAVLPGINASIYYKFNKNLVILLVHNTI